jgi:hypothetical protein
MDQGIIHKMIFRKTKEKHRCYQTKNILDYTNFLFIAVPHEPWDIIN